MRVGFFVVLLIVWPGLAAAEEAPEPGRRPLDFHVDPGWEGYRNRLVPDPPPRTRQHFGYRTTNRAGGARAGEIGGWIERSLTPASYAKVIPAKTLDDKLTASGRFAVTRADGGSGLLFGWFHESSRGWRTPNSLALRLDGNGGKYWVLYEYGTKNWRTGGGGAFEGERYQTTVTKPLPADGASHRWSLTYDPQGHQGEGELIFVLDGKPYRLPLAPGHKADGATFNRFGVWNQQTTGGGMEVYFDDVVRDGKLENFDDDPGWVGVGNDVEFADRALRPKQDFGYSRTRRAGGEIGEIGGLVWRDERPAYYAARLGPLSLEDELHASGRLVFMGAGSDSGVYLGWFDAASKRREEEAARRGRQETQRNLLAILIEGPSRVGHYFRPAYRTGDGAGRASDVGPPIKPDGRPHRWSLDYFPEKAGGRGRIVVTLDGRAQTLDLEPEHRRRGARFDRFGLFTFPEGGHHVRLYLDELSYTAQPGGR